MDTLDSLTPEQLQQILRLGTLSQGDKIIEEELQRAMAMGAPSGVEYSTPIGAALGGIGNIARGVGSELKQKDLRAQQKHNLTEEEQGRMLFAQLLRNPQPAAAPPAQQQPTEPEEPWKVPGFRYGL